MSFYIYELFYKLVYEILLIKEANFYQLRTYN